MLKKLLLCLIFIGLIVLLACDQYCVKRCIYDAYQMGEKISTEYVRYVSCSERCEDFSKSGNIYKLVDVEYMKYSEYKKIKR